MTWVYIILAIAVIVLSIIYWKIAVPIILVIGGAIVVWLIRERRKEKEEERILEAEAARFESEHKKLVKDLDKFCSLPEKRQQEICMKVDEGDIYIEGEEWNFLKKWIESALNKYQRQIITPLIQEHNMLDEILQDFINVFERLPVNETGYENCLFLLKLEWVSDYEAVNISPLCEYVAKYQKMTGIKPIYCNDMIVTRPCYLKAEIRTVNQRQHQGELYYDVANAQKAKLYVFEDALEFIDNSHWSIDISSILDMRIEEKAFPVENGRLNYILSISCRNRGNIFLLCDAYNLSMIRAVILQIRKRKSSGTKSAPTSQKTQTKQGAIKSQERSTLNSTILPWVGPDYIEGIAGMKVLIVGDCRCQDVSEWNEGYVADVIGKKYQAGNSDIPAYNVLTNVGKAVEGKQLSDDERTGLWNRLAFFNFFQEPVANLRKVTEVQIASGQKAFLQVLEKYAPDRVIACEPLYGYLPNEGRQGFEVTLSSPWKDGKIYSNKTWIYPLPYGKECRVMPIANPGGGFPWDYWHELIVEFLK